MLRILDAFEMMRNPGQEKELLARLDIQPNLLTMRDGHGQRLIHMAAIFGRLAILNKIASRDILNIDTKDVYERTPFHLAAAWGHIGILERLIQLGSQAVTMGDWLGRLPIHLAVMGCQATSYIRYSPSISIFRFLLNLNPASLREVATDGTNLLHCAAMSGSGANIEFLCREGLFDLIDAPDKHGSTPLHHAVASDNSGHAIETLLRLSPQAFKLEDNSGMTPKMLASLIKADTLNVFIALSECPEEELLVEFIQDVRYRVYFSQSLLDKLLWNLHQ